MSDIRFPMSLKPIVNRGYSQTRGSNIWRNSVQGGAPRQGRDIYFEPVPISITLVVSSLGRQAFYSFLNNIHGGADSFIMPNDTGLGVQDHLVWITSQISDNTDDGKNWIISFTATAERTAIQEDTCLTANLPDLYGCYGDCLGSFLRAYGTYMTTFPRVWEPNVIAQFNIGDKVFTGLSFSRASTGTYKDPTAGLLKTAAVDEPRYEVDGLLLEGGGVNTLSSSSDFTNNFWGKTNITISGGFSSPDGSLNAQKITANTVNGSHAILQSITPAPNTTYVYSVFIKAGEYTKAQYFVGVFSSQVASNTVTVDLATGTIISAPDLSRCGVVAVGGGWYRFWTRITTTATPTTIQARVNMADNSGNITFAGDGTSGFYLWGHQIEPALLVSSYIATTTSAGSRAADTLTLASGGTPTRIYRGYTPTGSTTPVTETVPYTNELCPPGHLRVLKILND